MTDSTDHDTDDKPFAESLEAFVREIAREEIKAALEQQADDIEARGGR